jgi:hypothetical protein
LQRSIQQLATHLGEAFYRTKLTPAVFASYDLPKRMTLPAERQRLLALEREARVTDIAAFANLFSANAPTSPLKAPPTLEEPLKSTTQRLRRLLASQLAPGIGKQRVLCHLALCYFGKCSHFTFTHALCDLVSTASLDVMHYKWTGSVKGYLEKRSSDAKFFAVVSVTFVFNALVK